MPFIPRQVKPPTRLAVTCKLPQQVAALLKCYAEFLDSSQEYVVTQTLQLAFRKDREFQTWLSAHHPDVISPLGETASATPRTVTAAAEPSEAGPVTSQASRRS